MEASSATTDAQGYPEWDSIDDSEDGRPVAAADFVRKGDDTKPDRVRPFSTGAKLRSQAIAEHQSPTITTDGVLTIPTHGAFVTRSGAVLIVRRKRQTVLETAFEALRHVTIESRGVAVSTSLMTECARQRVGLIISRESGLPEARVTPAR